MRGIQHLRVFLNVFVPQGLLCPWTYPLCCTEPWLPGHRRRVFPTAPWLVACPPAASQQHVPNGRMRVHTPLDVQCLLFLQKMKGLLFPAVEAGPEASLQGPHAKHYSFWGSPPVIATGRVKGLGLGARARTSPSPGSPGDHGQHSEPQPPWLWELVSNILVNNVLAPVRSRPCTNPVSPILTLFCFFFFCPNLSGNMSLPEFWDISLNGWDENQAWELDGWQPRAPLSHIQEQEDEVGSGCHWTLPWHSQLCEESPVVSVFSHHPCPGTWPSSGASLSAAGSGEDCGERPARGAGGGQDLPSRGPQTCSAGPGQRG